MRTRRRVHSNATKANANAPSNSPSNSNSNANTNANAPSKKQVTPTDTPVAQPSQGNAPTDSDKYPLADAWTYSVKMMKSRSDAGNDWANDYKTSCTVFSVETFWRLHANILGRKFGTFNERNIACTTHAFFRDGILHAWEDDNNKVGCSMHFYFTEADTKFADNVMLMCIGNEMDNAKRGLNGCTFYVKQCGKGMHKWKVSVWLKQNMSKSTVLIKDIRTFLSTCMPQHAADITSCRIDNHAH